MVENFIFEKIHANPRFKKKQIIQFEIDQNLIFQPNILKPKKFFNLLVYSLALKQV
jgi:hypothetical protein